MEFIVLLKFVYLKIEIHAFLQLASRWETFMLPHVESQGIISVGTFAFGKENGVIKSQVFIPCQTLSKTHFDY